MYSNKALRHGLFLLMFLILPQLLDKLNAAQRVATEKQAAKIQEVVVWWLVHYGLGSVFAILMVLLLFKFFIQEQRPIGLTCFGVAVLYCVSLSVASMFGVGGLPMFWICSVVLAYFFLELTLKLSFCVMLIFIISAGLAIQIRLLL